MTYPPQHPTPYGQYPQQPQGYGQYPAQPGQSPIHNPYGGHGYGMPPGPPPKKSKAGPIIAITTTTLAVVALLVTGFAWPGWFTGDDEPAPSAIGSTPTSQASTGSQAVAEAVIAKLNSRDIDGLARELACTGAKKQAKSGKGTNLEIDVYNAAPPLAPNNGVKVREIRTEFRLIEVRQTKPGDLRYDPQYKDDHVAKIAVTFSGVPEPVKDQIKDGEGDITLIHEKGQWRFCGMEIAGDGRGDEEKAGSGGSTSADPANPNSVAEAYVAAVNNKDQAGADRLICASGATVKPLTSELIKVGGQLTLNKPVALLNPDSTIATMELTGVAEGDTAKLLGSLWRETPQAPWCVNLIQMAR
jgi:hypothetical protein